MCLQVFFALFIILLNVHHRSSLLKSYYKPPSPTSSPVMSQAPSFASISTLTYHHPIIFLEVTLSLC